MQNLLETALFFLAYALVVLGVLVMTAGVAYGMIRMSEVRTRLHAAGKALFLGIVLLLAGLVVAARDPIIVWDPAIILRVVLVGLFVLLTTPVASRGFRRSASPRAKTKEDSGTVGEPRNNRNR